MDEKRNDEKIVEKKKWLNLYKWTEEEKREINKIQMGVFRGIALWVAVAVIISAIVGTIFLIKAAKSYNDTQKKLEEQTRVKDAERELEKYLKNLY